jgi:hypothetical protein
LKIKPDSLSESTIFQNDINQQVISSYHILKKKAYELTTPHFLKADKASVLLKQIKNDATALKYTIKRLICPEEEAQI